MFQAFVIGQDKIRPDRSEASWNPACPGALSANVERHFLIWLNVDMGASGAHPFFPDVSHVQHMVADAREAGETKLIHSRFDFCQSAPQAKSLWLVRELIEYRTTIRCHEVAGTN
jgi:hypothetical protein